MGILDEIKAIHEQARETATAVADNLVDMYRHAADRYIEKPAVRETVQFVLTVVGIGIALVGGTFIYVMYFVPTIVLASFIRASEALGGLAARGTLDLLGLVRHDLEPALNPIFAAALSELLGVEFTEADVGGGISPADRVARMEAIGARITETLEAEFVPDPAAGLQPGDHGVNTFLGFNVNFAVANAFISVIGEALTLGQMEEFRELGVTLAQNLGLGRLSRRGLSELVGTTVATPYEWHLNKKYRPTGLTRVEALEAYRRGFMSSDELAEKLARDGYSADKIGIMLNLGRQEITASQAINSFFRGDLDDGELLDYFRRQGFTDSDAQRLIGLAAPSLSVSQLWNLVKWGVLTRDQAIEELRLKGWSRLEAELVLKNEELGDANGRVREWANKLEKWLLDGFITRAQFNKAVDELPWSDEEKRWEKDQFLDVRCIPQKRMSKAEYEKSYLEGLVTLTEYQDFLCTQGYPENDRLLLTYLLLLEAASAEERQRRRENAQRKLREETAPPAQP